LVGVLLVTPLCLTWRQLLTDHFRNIVEFGASLAVLVRLSLFVFVGPTSQFWFAVVRLPPAGKS
jgi:hypothetical protein